VSRAVVRQVFTFSASSYIANLLNLAPVFLLPLIVIAGRGASEAAYYYVAFQVANLLYAGAYAVSESLLAEGSYAESGFRHLVERSAKLLGLALVPVSVVVALASGGLLLIFGAAYSDHATATLAILALAAPAVALNTAAASLLKLTNQFAALIVSNLIYVVVICGLAVVWVHRGLAFVACAWLIGNVACGGVASAAMFLRVRKQGRRGVIATTAP
jgi:O-antigen/teichoic acid export membrane protein